MSVRKHLKLRFSNFMQIYVAEEYDLCLEQRNFASFPCTKESSSVLEIRAVKLYNKKRKLKFYLWEVVFSFS